MTAPLLCIMNFSQGTLLSHEAQEEICPFFDTFFPSADVVEGRGGGQAETTTTARATLNR